MNGWLEQWATWSSYSMADLLMFSPRTYYRLFESYNIEVWPGQVAAAAAGLIVFVCMMRASATGARIASGLMAACWFWIAWAFFAERYAPINWAANYFAYMFAIQALLLLWFGVLRGRLAFPALHSFVDRGAFSFWLYAFGLFAYPLLAFAFGRPWRQFEMFGLAPDPTVVATLGMLLRASRAPALLLPIPLLWCVITGATLFTMQAPDAWIAPFIAVLALSLLAGKGLLAPARDQRMQAPYQ